MNKAVFFDRDGVINREVGEYVYEVSKFSFNDGILQCMKFFMKQGFRLFIITNQGGIAKNLYTSEDVQTLHDFMLNLLAEQNIIIDEIYYCPHHSKFEKCICRKPDSLMIEKAMARFRIDPLKSYFFGDKDTDYQAGIKAGLKSVKIVKNENLMNNKNIRDIMKVIEE